MNTTSLHEKAIQSPSLIEIANLKAALARYQTAADTSNLHLQRQALDSSNLVARCAALEQDNALLRTEVQFLRNVPDASPSGASLQVSELSLALRHVQDKYRLSEEALEDLNQKLALANKSKTRALYELTGMETLVRTTREREDEWKARVRNVEADGRRVEEEKKILEVCVREYADLVRGMEGRQSTTTPASATFPSTTTTAVPMTGLVPPSEGSLHSQESSTSGSSGVLSHSRTPSNPSTATTTTHTHSHSRTGSIISTRPIDTLHEGRLGLQRLLSEFHAQTERLEGEISSLHGELEMAQMKLEVAEKLGEERDMEVGRLRGERERGKREDRSAGVMVEKYMSFSQQSTNLLQTALQTQKKRHASTISTLESQIAALERTIDREQTTSSKLRETLDDLTLEISKESFGRRREVSLRLALMERERKIGALVEWWIGGMERGKDAWETGRDRAIERATSVLDLLRGGVVVEEEEREWGEWEEGLQGLKGEMEGLLVELGRESERRMELERRVVALTGQEEMDEVEARPSAAVDPNPQKVTSHASDEETPPTEQIVDIQPRHHAASPQEHEEPKSLEQATTADKPSISPTPAAQPIPPETPPATKVTPEPEAEFENPLKEIIDQLHGTEKRYDTLQSSFTGCHNALSELRSSLNSMAGEVSPTDIVGNYLVAAVERLDDYCEDARVELEILIADEARIAQGYETLLTLSSTTSVDGDELQRKISGFIDGTEPSMERAKVVFGDKLDNLMHDIAIIKREMHERLNPSSMEDTPLAHEGAVAFPSQAADEENGSEVQHPAPARRESGIWRTLTSSMLSPSTLTPRTPSPGPRPVPTFGSLMTSGRPRRPSTFDKSSADNNPLNHLGLRIAMPKSAHGQTPNYLTIHSPFPFSMRAADSTSSNGDVQPNSAPLSRVGSGWFGNGMVRARTMSSIHVPGFGVGMGMNPVTPKSASQFGRSMSRAGSDAGIVIDRGGVQLAGEKDGEEEDGVE